MWMKYKTNLSKRSIIAIVVVALVGTALLAYSSCNRPDEKVAYQNKAGHFGLESAPFHLIVLIPSEAKYFSKEIKRFQDVLQVILKPYLASNQVYIRTVPEPESVEQRNHYFEVLKGSDHQSILISPFEGVYSRYIRQLSAEVKIPHLFFSQEESSTCGEDGMSRYLWNLGVTTSMYVEPYLASLNQRFAKVASDVRFFFYVNEDEQAATRARLFKKLIEELGFEFAGAVSVDERYDDLYTTIRAIFGKVPDVTIGFMTARGRYNFFPQSSKLGLNLEMGISLEFGIEEEELRSFGKDAEGVIIPVTYVSDYISDQNDIFKQQLNAITGETSPTMASYKGFLVGKILDMVFSRKTPEELSASEDSNQHFISVLESLDKSKIMGPSGTVMINMPSHGLIQPMHIADFKEGVLHHSQYLGDITQSTRGLCDPEDS
jgi:hypothetical protein